MALIKLVDHQQRLEQAEGDRNLARLHQEGQAYGSAVSEPMIFRTRRATHQHLEQLRARETEALLILDSYRIECESTA